MHKDRDQIASCICGRKSTCGHQSESRIQNGSPANSTTQVSCGTRNIIGGRDILLADMVRRPIVPPADRGYGPGDFFFLEPVSTSTFHQYGVKGQDDIVAHALNTSFNLLQTV